MNTKQNHQNSSLNAGGNIAIILIALSAMVYAGWSYWSAETKKENEARLIFVGNQYKAAIGRYYENSPGPRKQFPLRLEDLVADGRVNPKAQYMVELYADPVGKGWGLLKDAEGGITGVHSLSDEEPSSDADARPDEYKNGDAYAQWVFQYVPLAPQVHPVTTVHRAENELHVPVVLSTPTPEVPRVEEAPKPAQVNNPTARHLPPPVGQIDVASIQLGSGVPGIPPLANETDRRRRICIVNATRYATSCVNQPEAIVSQEAARICVIEAQQRYEQCGGV